MRILFQGRVDLWDKRGGDTIQIEETAKELRKLGVGVDIVNNWKLNLSSYDLVHIFQLDWVCESYLYALNAKKQNKKLVLSPIHHSEREVIEFEEFLRSSFRRFVNPIFPSQESKDVLKNVYRSLFDLRKMYPTLLSIFYGYRKEQKEVLEMSDIVLAQTNKEAEDLRTDFKSEFIWKKIALGVG